MKLLKEVMHGDRIPAWYGVAWESLERHTLACLPIGLNLIASAARSLATWARHGGRSIPTNPREAWREGFNAGRASRG